MFSNYKLIKELALYSYKNEFLVFSSTKALTNNGGEYLFFFSFIFQLS